MKWFFVQSEGGEYQYVSLATLRRDGWRYPIVGAERGKVRVVYDRILAKRGLGPFQKIDRENFTMELFPR